MLELKKESELATMTKQLRSKDRKVTNAVSPNWKTPTISNTFRLPGGTAYSCRGATAVCGVVGYAGKLGKGYATVKKNVLQNWELLKDADRETMQNVVSEMKDEFNLGCKKRNAT